MEKQNGNYVLTMEINTGWGRGWGELTHIKIVIYTLYCPIFLTIDDKYLGMPVFMKFLDFMTFYSDS